MMMARVALTLLVHWHTCACFIDLRITCLSSWAQLNAELNKATEHHVAAQQNLARATADVKQAEDRVKEAKTEVDAANADVTAAQAAKEAQTKAAEARVAAAEDTARQLQDETNSVVDDLRRQMPAVHQMGLDWERNPMADPERAT